MLSGCTRQPRQFGSGLGSRAIRPSTAASLSRCGRPVCTAVASARLGCHSAAISNSCQARGSGRGGRLPSLSALPSRDDAVLPGLERQPDDSGARHETHRQGRRNRWRERQGRGVGGAPRHHRPAFASAFHAAFRCDAVGSRADSTRPACQAPVGRNGLANGRGCPARRLRKPAPLPCGTRGSLQAFAKRYATVELPVSRTEIELTPARPLRVGSRSAPGRAAMDGGRTNYSAARRFTPSVAATAGRTQTAVS